MGIDLQKFWIHGILSQKPSFQEGKGFDIDGNGAVDKNESLRDVNANGTVGDAEDYQKYLEKYRKELSAVIPFFRWGAFLKPDNPFHTLMYYYSDLYSDSLLEGAYHFIEELSREAKKKGGPSQTPEDQLLSIHRAMKDLRIAFEETDATGFPEDVQTRKFRCDKQSFATLAVGHEWDLPLFAVSLPGHTVVRWEDQFFVDAGEIQTERDYLLRFSVTPKQKEEGVYLRNFSQPELFAHFLFNRGLILAKRKDLQGAKEAYEKAIRWHDRFPEIYNNLGILLLKLGRPKESVEPLQKAVSLNEEDTNIRYNFATALFLSGQIETAKDHLRGVIRRNPADKKAQEMLDQLLRRPIGTPDL